MKFFVVVFTKKKCEKFQIKKIMGFLLTTHQRKKNLEVNQHKFKFNLITKKKLKKNFLVNSSIRRRGDRERMKPKTAALLQKTSFQGEKYYYDKHKPSPKRRTTK